LVLRSLARSMWRRLTPPERVVIVGSDGLARSIRRKLELFSDIHAAVTGEYRAISPEILRNGHGWGRRVDRIILAAQAIDERLIAELVALCRREHGKLRMVPPARGVLGTAVQRRPIAARPVPSTDEPGRAAAAPERLEGRDEPRRPAAGAGRARSPVPARAPVPPGSQTRLDGPDAGLRPRPAELRGTTLGRARVHREPV